MQDAECATKTFKKTICFQGINLRTEGQYTIYKQHVRSVILTYSKRAFVYHVTLFRYQHKRAVLQYTNS